MTLPHLNRGASPAMAVTLARLRSWRGLPQGGLKLDGASAGLHADGGRLDEYRCGGLIDDPDEPPPGVVGVRTVHHRKPAVAATSAINATIRTRDCFV